MKKAGAIVALLILFLCICVALIPTQHVVRDLDPDSKYLVDPTGTIWYGGVATRVGTRALGRLSWELEPSSLMSGRIGYAITYKGVGFDFSCEASFGWTRQDGLCSGLVESRAANLILSHYEIDISGRLNLENLLVRIRSNGLVEEAAGKLHWEGGSVHYRLSDVAHQTELPALEGMFHNESDLLGLDIYEKANKNLLLKTTFDPQTGEFRLSATNRLIVLADAPWTIYGELDATAFTVSERVAEPF